MIKLFLVLILSACSFSAYSASILPQYSSNGEDGSYSINTSNSLFADSDNIYNFTDFSILDGASLSISSPDPVFIYSQTAIYIDGSIFFDAGDLNLIAPEISFAGTTEFNMGTSGSITIVTNEATLSGDTPSVTGSTITSDGSGSIVLSSGGNVAVLSGSIVSSGILITEPVPTLDGGIITISPPTAVPLPAAGWLMLSGLSLLIATRRKYRSEI